MHSVSPWSSSSLGVFPMMRHCSQNRAIIRMTIASRKVDSVRNIRRGSRMPNSRPTGENTGRAAVIVNEETLMTANAMV